MAIKSAASGTCVYRHKKRGIWYICVFVAVQKRGIWYLFPEQPVGESSGKAIMQPDEARHTAYLEFNNNAVHSYRYVSHCR